MLSAVAGLLTPPPTRALVAGYHGGRSHSPTATDRRPLNKGHGAVMRASLLALADGCLPDSYRPTAREPDARLTHFDLTHSDLTHSDLMHSDLTHT